MVPEFMGNAVRISVRIADRTPGGRGLHFLQLFFRPPVLGRRLGFIRLTI